MQPGDGCGSIVERGGKGKVAGCGARLALVFASALWLLAAPPETQAATFLVDSTGDAVDSNIGNGTCATAGGVCTLRAAIAEANSTMAADTINFGIAPAGAKTITLGLALPTITRPVTINGTTQPGWVAAGSYPPVVRVNGNGLGLHVLNLQPGSSGSTIRGLCLNNSTQSGIRIVGSSNNVVAGNFIGTNPAGTAAGPGNAEGVFVGNSATATDDNRIGGTAAADRNIISENTVDGVVISGGTGGAARTLVQGNYIGTDVTGTLDLGNTNQGVAVFGTNTDTVIGGTAPGAGNVICGNNIHGVGVSLAGTTGTIIQGNRIGVGATGAALPNAASGLRFDTSTTGNLVGGTVPAAANIIAHNTTTGFRLVSNCGSNCVSILGNAIHSNGSIAIDLNANGVTANDAGDGDSGSNDLLNFPVVTSTYTMGSNLVVNFSLDVPAGSYRIEFFKNPSGGDVSGFGEGEVFTSFRNVTHAGGGSTLFSHSFAGSIGDRITATTTRCTDGATCAAFGSTSEFSAVNLVTTAVTLVSFTATPLDSGVDLRWQTGSELSNLGFHVYRSLSAQGPFERITDGLIPGLGNSPEGARYSYRDAGLSNGTTYFYQLEDVETTGRTKRHGPVAAAPQEGKESAESDSDAEGASRARITYGDPASSSFRILERSARHAVIELRTGGFFATALTDGTVRLEAPSLQEVSGPGEPNVPVLRTWIEAIAGRTVEIAAVRPDDIQSFALRPEDAPERELQASADGTTRLVHRRARRKAWRHAFFPEELARILTTAFQGDVKKAQLELAPLRYDVRSGKLLLARTLTVRISFAGHEPEEASLGGARGRRRPRVRHSAAVLARLGVKEAGLYAVAFEDIFGPGGRSLPAAGIGLSRQGELVPFRLEPANGKFGPGSLLVFVSAGAALNPYAAEAVYELVRSSTGGSPMPVASAVPAGTTVASYVQERRFETNRLYQAALVNAPDLWLWDYIVAPANKAYPFTLSQPTSSGLARLTVELQGGSDFPANPDHHVRVSVNGSVVAGVSWDGMVAYTVDAEVPSTFLRDGANQIEIHNVGDTGAASSLVMLNRFTLAHPRATVAEGGRLEGAFESDGTAVAAGLSTASYLVDVTGATPRWLTGAALTPQGLAFRVERGHRYLAVAREAVLRPRIAVPTTSSLRSTVNQADYVVLTPREFLEAANLLVEHRRSQGLSARAVAVEDVYAEFGFGETSPLAIKEFLAYAYHEWSTPSPRYVVLLGDATYDPKDYAKTGYIDRIPGFMVKTQFLWTISDPWYASINGDDLLPDLSLGRLSANSLAEAQAMVAKVLAYERSGASLAGPKVLVADNTDIGGTFEANADEIAAGILNGNAQKIYISQLGGGTRAAIHAALDRGASIMSYIGHGSTVIWASENVFNNMDLPSLAPQTQQPLLFTMDCLNGYFHMPGLSSLAEAFVKADGRGAVAAFAPSGMSVDGPAHVYHKAALEEVLSGRHARFGDALLAAQARYTQTGAFPELLSLYHLLGDPALVLR